MLLLPISALLSPPMGVASAGVPCRSGLDVREVFRRYTRAYSAQVSHWIYSEQALAPLPMPSLQTKRGLRESSVSLREGVPLPWAG